jgi:hypothetical protein
MASACEAGHPKGASGQEQAAQVALKGGTVGAASTGAPVRAIGAATGQGAQIAPQARPGEATQAQGVLRANAGDAGHLRGAPVQGLAAQPAPTGGTVGATSTGAPIRAIRAATGQGAQIAPQARSGEATPAQGALRASAGATGHLKGASVQEVATQRAFSGGTVGAASAGALVRAATGQDARITYQPRPGEATPAQGAPVANAGEAGHPRGAPVQELAAQAALTSSTVVAASAGAPVRAATSQGAETTYQTRPGEVTPAQGTLRAGHGAAGHPRGGSVQGLAAQMALSGGTVGAAPEGGSARATASQDAQVACQTRSGEATQAQGDLRANAGEAGHPRGDPVQELAAQLATNGGTVAESPGPEDAPIRAAAGQDAQIVPQTRPGKVTPALGTPKATAGGTDISSTFHFGALDSLHRPDAGGKRGPQEGGSGEGATGPISPETGGGQARGAPAIQWGWTASRPLVVPMDGHGAFKIPPSVVQSVRLPSLRFLEPFASAVLNGNKRLDGRSSLMLKQYAGQIVGVRVSPGQWRGATPKLPGKVDRRAAERVDTTAGIMLVGETMTKDEAARRLPGGQAQVAAMVGLPFAAVGAFVTEILAAGWLQAGVPDSADHGQSKPQVQVVEAAAPAWRPLQPLVPRPVVAPVVGCLRAVDDVAASQVAVMAIDEQEGDGSCLFHSVVAGLARTGVSGPSDARQARDMICTWMLAHAEMLLPIGLTLRAFVEAELGLEELDSARAAEERFAQYVGSMRPPSRRYGGAPELIAAARVWNVDINVWTRMRAAEKGHLDLGEGRGIFMLLEERCVRARSQPPWGVVPVQYTGEHYNLLTPVPAHECSAALLRELEEQRWRLAMSRSASHGETAPLPVVPTKMRAPTPVAPRRKPLPRPKFACPHCAMSLGPLTANERRQHILTCAHAEHAQVVCVKVKVEEKPAAGEISDDDVAAAEEMLTAAAEAAQAEAAEKASLLTFAAEETTRAAAWGEWAVEAAEVEEEGGDAGVEVELTAEEEAAEREIEVEHERAAVEATARRQQAARAAVLAAERAATWGEWAVEAAEVEEEEGGDEEVEVELTAEEEAAEREMVVERERAAVEATARQQQAARAAAWEAAADVVAHEAAKSTEPVPFSASALAAAAASASAHTPVLTDSTPDPANVAFPPEEVEEVEMETPSGHPLPAQPAVPPSAAPLKPIPVCRDGTPRLTGLNRDQWRALCGRFDIPYEEWEPAASLATRVKPAVHALRWRLRRERAAAVTATPEEIEAEEEVARAQQAAESAARQTVEDEAPRVVLQPSPAVGEVACDFGPAADIGAFTRLARYVGEHPRVAAELSANDLAAVGVIKCTGCRLPVATVGQRPGLQQHWASKCKDGAHILAAEGKEPGWIGELCAEAQHSAPLGSAAHYYNVVVSPLVKGGGKLLDAQALLLKHRVWMAETATRDGRKKAQEAVTEALKGAEKEAEEAAWRHAATLGSPAYGLPPAGGAFARQWGHLARGKAQPQVGSLGWLADVPTEQVKTLDALVARLPMQKHRKEYYDTLTAFLDRARHGMGSTAGSHAWKAIVLFKAVTTGRLQGREAHAPVETLGRIRQVAAGHLQTLVLELFADAERVVDAREQAAVAQQLEAARALADAASPEAIRVRKEVVAARLIRHGMTAEAAAAEADTQVDGELRVADGVLGHEVVEDPPTVEGEKKLRKVLRLCAAGYLSKGYSTFKKGGLAKTAEARVRNDMSRLHPQREPPQPLGVPPAMYETSYAAFVETFQAPPKERGLGMDALSYEEYAGVFHHSKAGKQILYNIVSSINRGDVHPDTVALLGDSYLVGLEKPDKSTRPIGVGTAIRRLAGRCIYKDLKDEIAAALTTTRPSAAQLQRAGFAPDRACNAPLQLGCATEGGAEIAIKITRLLLEANPDWAVLSDDKTNGYNTLQREAILRGVREFFPKLLPTVEMWYCRHGGLYYRHSLGIAAATDGDDVAFYSAEGCTQGDPLGPLLWCLAYHTSLVELQARHPDAVILCYLDDTYVLQVPAAALQCMQDGADITAADAGDGGCGVLSNQSKQEVFASDTADLSGMPATIRGAPTAPPCEEAGYEGGRLKSIKVLGAFVGDTVDCERRLLARVEKHLKPLEQMVRLHDTRNIKVAMQVQMMINRYCANTQLTYFLRAMSLKATRAPAVRHDVLISAAFEAIVNVHQATQAERSRARRQARLPVRMGGLGLSAQSELAPAACVGSWALCWRPMQQLCPREFADLDLVSMRTEACEELRVAHATLVEEGRRVRATWAAFDRVPFDYGKDGEPRFRYHPAYLPAEGRLEPVSGFGSTSDNLKHAQRTWSSIIHHSQWYKLFVSLLNGDTLREAARLVAVSQPHAGAFLNAVPSLGPFRIGSWALRIIVQRRLGLPLSAAAAEGVVSRHDLEFDVFGDVAANDGEAGHQTRHHQLLVELVARLRSVWAGAVVYEPRQYAYSDKRPDLEVHGPEGLLGGDVKLKDPLGSNPADVETDAAHVAFAATLPAEIRSEVGWAGQGVSEEVDGRWSAETGKGYVPPHQGAYDRAQRNGVEVLVLLFETFGGFSPAVLKLLQRAADSRGDKLRGSEYDETTWSARSWTVYTVQRLSCILARAVAWEIATAMGLPRSVDVWVRADGKGKKKGGKGTGAGGAP